MQSSPSWEQDHLQEPTIRAKAGWDATFVVPLGVGAHLEYWGVPAESIVELDWWQATRVGALEIVATASRHASGRHALDQMRTLWSSYALLGPAHRVFFSGDTGMHPALKEVGGTSTGPLTWPWSRWAPTTKPGPTGTRAPSKR